MIFFLFPVPIMGPFNVTTEEEESGKAATEKFIAIKCTLSRLPLENTCANGSKFWKMYLKFD